jgi:3',5'-cyclic AMP phosphodiesterase CpdA
MTAKATATRTIAHISDLHFGTEDRAIAAALLAELDGTGAPVPSVVAISGDLTQRARPEQFRAARAFLDSLPGPCVVVPGNHDVPLYHLFDRLVRPLHRYRHFMREPLMPVHADSELAVFGVTTAHGFTFKGGRITREMTETVAAAAAPIEAGWKVLVAHHPFVLPADGDPSDRVRGAEEAVPLLEEAGIEMILTGHLHVTYSSDPTAFRSDDKAVIQVHAGTAISQRRRGEPNGYNLLTFAGDEVAIAHRIWDGARFVTQTTKSYRRAPGDPDGARTTGPAPAPHFIPTGETWERTPP